MKPDHTKSLSRLVAAARRAQPSATEQTAAPSGFATRVVARAELGRREQSLGAGLERFAARMLGLAALCALATVLWSGLPGAGEVRAADAELDPVGLILEAAQ